MTYYMTAYRPSDYGRWESVKQQRSLAQSARRQKPMPTPGATRSYRLLQAMR